MNNWPASLLRHWRPLAFGAAALVILIGLVVLDRALSRSEFSAVFVGGNALAAPESAAPSTPPREAELAALRMAAEEARQLLESQRQIPTAEQARQDLQSELLATLQRWKQSWVAQDVGGYLAFYAPDFETPFGISREDWASFRIQRIQEPRWIRVELEQVDFVQLEPDYAALSLTQLYATPGYADRTRKHMDLVRTGQGWQIRRERAVETVRTDDAAP